MLIKPGGGGGLVSFSQHIVVKAKTTASKLVELAISEMTAGGAHEVNRHLLWLGMRLMVDRT